MADLVDHPYDEVFWRHDPPVWAECWVCGGPTCWVEADLGYCHPECEYGPGLRVILGKNDESFHE